MDSDSGLAQSPTLEEDDYRTEYHELHATPRTDNGPAEQNLSIADGGSREETAPIDVEALAREVESLLSQCRRQREARREENYEFEYSAEQGLLSRELSLESLNQPDGETHQERTSGGNSSTEKGDAKPRSLSDYQQYWRVGNDRTRQTKTADKYRLSFVELSDSSEGEEEENHAQSSYHPLSAVKRTAVLPSAERNGITSNKGHRQSLPAELLSVHDSSLEQLADMQYDDEGMETLSPPDYTGLRLSSSIMPKSSLPCAREISTRIPSRQSNGHHPFQESTLVYDDEDLDFLLPSAEDVPTGATAMTNPHTLSVSSENPSKTLSTLSYHSSQQSTLPTAKENSIESCGKSSRISSVVNDAAPRHLAPQRGVHTQKVVPTLDHSSSPLHKMSIAQLQYMVQLLETKLQASSGHLIRLLQERESLMAENNLLNTNIAKISKRLQQLYGMQKQKGQRDANTHTTKH